jgi:hypothetical protein
MDPEFTKFADDVANIATSGRWAAVNAGIKRLAANPGVGNEWYVQLMGSLCFQVFSEYLHLKKAYEEKQDGDVSLLAWRERNLLELSVWSIYCSNSRDNARRLYEDAGRDVVNLVGAFKTFSQAPGQSIDWLGLLTSTKQDLIKRAAAEGIETLDKSYLKMEAAAEDCGIRDYYKMQFKMCSKFAHPTAMRILGPPDDTKQRDYFFSQGCLSFTAAFVALESALI